MSVESILASGLFVRHGKTNNQRYAH